MASIKDLKRMCGSYGECNTCPLCIEDVTRCKASNLPNNVEEIVDKWVAEHPVKTYLADFKKKFPKARINSKGTPGMCVHFMYGDDACECCRDCNKCWNQEMKND